MEISEVATWPKDYNPYLRRYRVDIRTEPDRSAFEVIQCTKGIIPQPGDKLVVWRVNVSPGKNSVEGLYEVTVEYERDPQI